MFLLGSYLPHPDQINSVRMRINGMFGPKIGNTGNETFILTFWPCSNCETARYGQLASSKISALKLVVHYPKFSHYLKKACIILVVSQSRAT